MHIAHQMLFFAYERRHFAADPLQFILALRLISQRNECVQPVFAQKDPTPHQRTDIDWEEEVGEDWIADAQMGSDCAAQKPGQQDRAKNGGTRNRIDGSTGEFEYPNTRSETIGISELNE